MKDAVKEYNATEDALKALQSVGQVGLVHHTPHRTTAHRTWHHTPPTAHRTTHRTPHIAPPTALARRTAHRTSHHAPSTAHHTPPTYQIIGEVLKQLDDTRWVWRGAAGSAGPGRAHMPARPLRRTTLPPATAHTTPPSLPPSLPPALPPARPPARFIVKASSGPRYVVGCRNKLDKTKLLPGVRVVSSQPAPSPTNPQTHNPTTPQTLPPITHNPYPLNP